MSDGKLPVADDDVLPIQQEHPQPHPQPQSHEEPPPPLLTLTQVLPTGLDDDAGLGRKRAREDTGLSGLHTDPTTQQATAMGTHMTTTDHMAGVGIIDPNDEEARKRRKTIAPPKKLNNEQWDHMFERLVKYKQQHGVSGLPYFFVLLVVDLPDFFRAVASMRDNERLLIRTAYPYPRTASTQRFFLSISFQTSNICAEPHHSIPPYPPHYCVLLVLPPAPLPLFTSYLSLGLSCSEAVHRRPQAGDVGRNPACSVQEATGSQRLW